MKPEIKSLWSPDLPEPHEQFVPPDPTNFSVYMTADIGPQGEEGQEQFGFYCETTAAHAERAKHHPGGKSIIVDPYSWTSMRESVERICQSAIGANWNEVSAQLSNHFDWEFENYKP